MNAAKNGPRGITYNEFRTFLEENKGIPDEENEAFVLDYFIEEERGAPNANEYEEDRVRFVAVFSTKRLLQNAMNALIIHVDGTYKLNRENYPLQLFGTTDKNRAFHNIAFAIVSNEDIASYEFCFRSINARFCEIFEQNIKINILVSDISAAIKAAFKRVYPDGKEVSCFFHVKKNIQTYLKSSPNKDGILADIDKLQLCENVFVFDFACRLFSEKWVKKQRNFVRYFERQWLKDGIKNWYEGVGPYIPSTNNALESTNKRIKDDFNLRHRCPISVFKTRVFTILKQYSLDYTDGKRKVKEVVEIDKKNWIAGKDWAKSPKIPTLESENAEYSYYYVPAGNGSLSVTAEAIEAHKNLSYGNFHQFVSNHFGIWKVSLPKDKDSFGDAQCTCPQFFKVYICKHIIGMGLRLKLVDIPLEIRKLETVQGRGRPKKTGLALSRI